MMDTRLEEDKRHLLNMADAIKEVQSNIADVDYISFEQNETMQRALAQNFREIGGAAKLLSPEFKKNFPEVDWNVFARLDDAAMGFDYEIDPHAVWAMVENEFPVFKDFVLEIEEKIENEDWEPSGANKEVQTDPNRQSERDTSSFGR